MANCSQQHRFAAAFEQLPESQGDAGRHKCAGCAYQSGFDDGINNRTRNYNGIVNSLPDSQAGAVRHKDPDAAYNLGYDDGQAKFNGNIL